MPEATLAHRPDVELVNVGSWQLLSGSWNPNRKDILAAVEASKCPAVRRPKLKLGHLDPRFNTADDKTLDGTPSLGWFDNLRASDDGNTLLGDQVALPWLNQVQAAAWPDRSIEGKYNSRCGLGHTHPFVVTAVSLLGETPPGIPTLKSIKSLEDLPAALGVAAAGEVPEGGEDVQATIRASAQVYTGAIIALVPAVQDAERLAIEGGLAAEELHLTLAYLGEAADLGARGKQDVIDHVSSVVNGLPKLEAELFSAAVLNPGDASPDRDPCIVWLATGDMLDAVHDLVDETLPLIDAPIPSQIRPWLAHVSAAYDGDLGRLGGMTSRMGTVSFDRLRLAFGGEFIDIPLMEWPGEDTEPDEGAVAAAAGSADSMHDYWTKGAGLAKWKGKPHPWTALFRQLSRHLSPDRAKRTASKWYREVMGHMPNQRKVAAAAPDLPAAEPEPTTTQEDIVSLSDNLRSRLGLADDADETAALAAIDALKTAAETKPEPTPEMVAASAAATEKADKAEQAQALMREELTKVRGELDTIKASAAMTVKASAFEGWLATGRLKPADRETWEARYDRDPQMVSEILGGRREGEEVPVMASGVAGSPEPTGNGDAQFEDDYARHFGNDKKAAV